MIEAVQGVCRYYKDLGLSRIRYRAIPRIYQRAPVDDDLYALFRAGAHRYRCDLSAVVDLGNRLGPSRRRRRCLRTALARGVLVREDPTRLGEFWTLLEENLLRRHQVRPVHTLEEIQLLLSRFPGQIRLIIALTAEQIIGGVVLFETPTALHSQYICASELGHSAHALDAVLEHCIATGTNASLRWFSMGTSNECDGTVLNDTLYRFKTEFGAGGVVHEFYQIDLR